jgi:uncharacterized membrane protein
METKVRSMSKSILWRIAGVIILATITYAYTHLWIQTTAITFLHHFIFLFVFYFHERVWLKIERPSGQTARSVAKMFTYETLLGNIILGAITFCITGSWRQMTAITLTYIGIKHVCYIINEFVWKRIKLGVR